MADLQRLFGAAREERYRIDVDLPRGVRGRVFLNGPGGFEWGDAAVDHWLDGDGMVMSLTLGVEGAQFARRYVRTRKWREETAAGTRLFRRFGSGAGAACAWPCNVSVHHWRGRLLACGALGRPYELDPETLDTIGEWDGGGCLPDDPFLAVRVRPHGDSLLIAWVDGAPELRLVELGADATPVWEQAVPLAWPHVCADFGVTDRYVIVHLSGVCLDRGRLEAGAPCSEALREVEVDSELLFAERAGSFVGRVPTAPGFVPHFIDCFDSGPFVAVNVIESEGHPYRELGPLSSMFTTAAPARPVRYVVDAAGLEVVERGALGYGQAPAFPTADPTTNGQQFWALGMSRCGLGGAKFYDQLVHARWSSPFVEDVHTVDGALGGEPVRVGAHVLVQHFDGLRSAFLVYEAERVAAGPVAKILLRSPTPFAFHHSGVEAAAGNLPR